jgi:asparagine synthase (glutamine-hydrolysing)
MCGITFCFSSSLDVDQVRQRLQAMEQIQHHRGPDDRGMVVKSFGQHSFGLGQQRLSIIDLSSAGHQPMVSPCGRYLLSYNGEIYNYRELAGELGDDPILKISSGDTAVALAALVRWGVEAFRRFNGMWAIAFLDLETRTLLLSRDRMGVKPLYYSLSPAGDLVVASEIKGVLAGSGARKFKLNRDVIARFLLQGQIAAQPETFFQGIQAFPPASYAKLSLDSAIRAIEPVVFWKHPFEIPDRPRQSIDSRDVRDVFLDSVRLRMRADVPVGIMLSGGLDSSAILAAAHHTAPDSDLHAFSAVSRDPTLNEEVFIDRMLRHIKCQSFKVQTDEDPQRVWNELDDTIWYFEHPCQSLSNVVHRSVIKAAREKGLIVLLTGQGADEQLAGYNKFFYFYMQDRLRRGRFAGPLSMLAGCLLNRTIIHEFKLKNAKRYIPFLRERLSRQWVGSKLSQDQLLDTGLGGSFEEREWKDLRRFSLPALLTSEDRMSMSHSCEMRTPFLDYRLVEMLGSLPPEKKLVRGWTKHILREAMQDLLPREIAWRKDKKGYTLPEDRWLRTELRAPVEAFFKQPMISADLGLVDPLGAQSLFSDFLHRRAGIRFQDIVGLVSLEKWLVRFERFVDKNS